MHQNRPRASQGTPRWVESGVRAGPQNGAKSLKTRPRNDQKPDQKWSRTEPRNGAKSLKNAAQKWPKTGSRISKNRAAIIIKTEPQLSLKLPNNWQRILDECICFPGFHEIPPERFRPVCAFKSPFSDVEVKLRLGFH